MTVLDNTYQIVYPISIGGGLYVAFNASNSHPLSPDVGCTQFEDFGANEVGVVDSFIIHDSDAGECLVSDHTAIGCDIVMPLQVE
jgi:hypothetical protein